MENGASAILAGVDEASNAIIAHATDTYLSVMQ
jgi:hypothetical protein